MILVALMTITVLLCSVQADDELECSVNKFPESGPVSKDDIVTFTCRWSGSENSTEKLNWYRIESGKEVIKISSDDGSFVWPLTGRDNGVEFSCLGQNVTSTKMSQCSIIPLAIIPTVSVRSLPNKLILGQGASFHCNADGLPSIASYIWYVDGMEDDGFRDRLKSKENGTIVEIAGFLRSDNGSVITCEVYVPSGLAANASLTIELELPSSDETTFTNLWIFIACAAAGGIPVFVLLVVCLVWCLRKAHTRGSRSRKKRSQSRRHIVLNEETNEPREQPRRGTLKETTLNETVENGRSLSLLQQVYDDDGTHPPPHKPAPPPTVEPDTYVNTPAPRAAGSAAATMPHLGQRKTSTQYNSSRPSHQRKKTEYENVACSKDDLCQPHDNSSLDGDAYENVAPSRPLSPKPVLCHTSSMPNFSQVAN